MSSYVHTEECELSYVSLLITGNSDQRQAQKSQARRHSVMNQWGEGI